jgi:hypothetical protein
MGNSVSTNYINFEDIQHAISNKEYIIINTLSTNQQACLIVGTLPISDEVDILNKQLKVNRNIRIIIYGMNSSDPSVNKKYEQLHSLGFINVFIYRGGLFEWLLLQDIYGKDMFLTTSLETDILKFKGHRQFNMKYIEYD